MDAAPPVPEAGRVPGWRLVHAGKVRELYEPADADADADGRAAVPLRDDTRTRPRPPGPTSDRLLVVASDRISAFDHVLPTTIPDKGAILTALTLWWFARLDSWDLPLHHHLVGAGEADGVPASLVGRAMVCRRLDMLPVECIVRGYLTGSGLADYRATGAVGGIELPPGLVDGDRLRAPIFTPSTKAAIGEHDENVNLAAVAEAVGEDLAERSRAASLAVYVRAAEMAADRGVIIADTKFELGLDPRLPPQDPQSLVLGDEMLTPDSSRFWPADGWQPGRAQESFDKQYVRDWLLSPSSGWSRTSGEAPPALPDDVVERTRARYVEAYERLTGERWR